MLNGLASTDGEIADLEKKKTLNGVAVILDGISFVKVGSAPQASEDSIDVNKRRAVEPIMEHSVAEDSLVGQEVLGLDSGNYSSDSVSNEKSRRLGAQKLSGGKKISSPPNRVGRGHCTVPQPFALATENRASGTSRRVGGESKVT